ncbi:SUKH-4 family immunity protein [Luteolibacter soli]|uniref:SUKH-4 family immunity protein n=1 Tax=Luteolibacter soli TaxID=3135280 RepID=A0ABU9ATH8_9BACT
MTPREFKTRFQKAQEPAPEGVDLDLGRFRDFPRERIEELKIDEASKALLREVGLPEEAAPFLSFGDGPDKVLKKLSSASSFLDREFDRYRLLGSNGSGDFVCIDESDGSVIYLNHDSNMKRVFINSSVLQFAESLCLMAEAIQSDFAFDFGLALARIDPAALNLDAMWPVEYEMIKGSMG